MNHPRLTLHKAGHGYIGRLSVPKDFLSSAKSPQKQKNTNQECQTIFILDRSGSMGQHVQRMSKIVIPAVARRYLKLKSNDEYTLITFDSTTETFVSTVERFERLEIRSQGCTYMAGVFTAVTQNVKASCPHLRIIAISDGYIHDTDATLRAAAATASQLKQTHSISATAIRLFTSSSQPDTRALASILQLNTEKPGNIIDIEATGTPQGLEFNIELIGPAIGSQEFGASYSLTAASPCLLPLPWSEATSEIRVNGLSEEKPTSIWLSAVPQELTLNGVSIEIDNGERVTHDTLRILLEDKITYFLDQLRVLKVVNSESSKVELERIVSYFQNLEDSLPPPADLSPLLEDKSLLGRAKYMKASIFRRLKSVTTAMQSIANDQRVANLNMAQQADYLRQAGDGTSRCPKALARRAEVTGIDFAATMRAEVLAMSAHIDKLEDIDDSNHAVSFYSRATTLEGIRCMVDLANEPEVFNQLSAADMLRLFNVVGIPAVGPIGDFPDPMTYRLEKFLYGSYVSVADITMAMHQGGALMAPGQQDQIVTAVPFFEEPRVQKFLQRHARSSLEYICSIGMRRMIAEVPKTYAYTICGGLWQMVAELDSKGKTEIRAKHFEQLVLTYEQAVPGFFDHIIPLLKTNQNPKMSYYLGHNGITNMIAPILHMIRHSEPLSFMPRILRALYSFETYQVMRRVARDIGPNARTETLDEILGVDFSSSRATPLPPMFSRTEPLHSSEAVVNSDSLGKFTKMLWFVPYATLLQPFFEALIHSENPIDALRAIPKMSDESVVKALDLPSSITLEDFLLFNVVEALLYGDKASRVDKDTNKPLLPDLGNPDEGAKMIRTYVASRYAQDYKKRLAAQALQEQKILQEELIATMVSTEDPTEFVKCITSGKERGCVSVSIDRENSAGFVQLHDALMDQERTVPKRAVKLYIIYSGRSPLTTGDDNNNNKVFNGGNMYTSGDWKPLQALLVSVGKEAVWEELQKELKERGHQYRGGSDLANRHGHSNDLKSYYAFGCQTLEQFHAVSSEQSWTTYIRDHCDCCGVSNYLAQSRAAAFTS